jgi:lysozyme
MLLGYDVSSVQGKVPWDKVAADPRFKFAIVKCYTGNDGKDPFYMVNIEAARGAGLRVGAYYFAYPLPHLDPKDQARNFFAVCGGIGTQPGDLPPILDAEWPAPEGFAKWNCTPQQVREWVLACLQEMERLWGVTPMVYSYPYWEASVHTELLPELARFPLHQANYEYNGKIPPEGYSPKVAKPWDKATIVQFDGNGGLKLPNGADVDVNMFIGTEADWQAFLRLPTVEQAQESVPAVT